MADRKLTIVNSPSTKSANPTDEAPLSDITKEQDDLFVAADYIKISRSKLRVAIAALRSDGKKVTGFSLNDVADMLEMDVLNDLDVAREMVTFVANAEVHHG